MMLRMQLSAYNSATFLYKPLMQQQKKKRKKRKQNNELFNRAVLIYRTACFSCNFKKMFIFP